MYTPATGNDHYPDSDNTPSGAYIFKPKRGDSDKKQYSTFGKITTMKFETTGVNAFELEYRDEESEEMYTALILTVPGANTLEWEVQLHAIPVSRTSTNTGKEVVANWDLVNFASANTFYTDSNGLEMQKRILNERPDFTLETHEFASSNYYPINSAIAIRDTSSGMQLTVMNDRSQAGSVLADGSVELLQNRRL